MARGIRLVGAAMVAMVALADGAAAAHAQRLADRVTVDPPPVPPPFRHGSRGAVTPVPTVPSPVGPPSQQSTQDDVLMAEAIDLQRAGDMRGARRVYVQLIKSFPNSRHIPSVYLSFGDYYFDQGSLNNATRFYEKVVQFPRYPHLDYALLKLGWTHFNLGDFQKALAAFHRANPLARGSGMSLAIEDGLVRAYERIGKPQTAFKFFQRQNKRRALAMLETLGWLYHRSGNSQKALFVMRELQRKAPISANRCRWQTAVVEATAASRPIAERQRAVVKLIAVANDMKIRRSPGAKQCVDTAGRYAYWQATDWQRQAHKTQGLVAYLSGAAAIYDAYVKSFPRGSRATDARYYHAEALWRLARLAKSRTHARALWQRAALAFHAAAADPTQAKARAAVARRAARLADDNARCMTSPRCQ